MTWLRGSLCGLLYDVEELGLGGIGRRGSGQGKGEFDIELKADPAIHGRQNISYRYRLDEMIAEVAINPFDRALDGAAQAVRATDDGKVGWKQAAEDSDPKEVVAPVVAVAGLDPGRSAFAVRADIPTQDLQALRRDLGETRIGMAWSEADQVVGDRVGVVEELDQALVCVGSSR
ncbi:MAG: hypothetical protein OEY14_17195, partial [Myxococcales bacterium]|nr:hypothetical protein [Myxococcales bacterium]